MEVKNKLKITPNIKLFGTQNCHKTQYYMSFFDSIKMPYLFLNVSNSTNAEELRSLYVNRKLNFPTITIGAKKLRNPNDADLNKWISKLILNND